MELSDFSPPSKPTLDHQRDALQKGLGRAMRWAKSGLLEADLLLEACLHDQRFDRQCEDNRGDWLWTLITESNRISDFSDAILLALKTASAEEDAYQLCQLALNFARHGDDRFRAQLFEFVGKRQIPDSPNIGEGQLLALAGDEAFQFIVRLRGRHLTDHDWEWDDHSVVDHAIEVIGEDRVLQILDESSEPDIRRFASEWQCHQRPPVDPEEQRRAYEQRMKAISAQEVVRAALTGEKGFRFRGWGMQAAENDLSVVLHRLWHEQDPDVVVRLLQVFSNRPLPQFDQRLLAYCRHPHENVQRWAFNALEKNAHPMIREFALSELTNSTLDRPVVDLFIKNFEVGDEQLILEHVEFPDDACVLHWMLMDVTDLLEENDQADCRQLGPIVYFHTPCSNCRFHAARLLRDRQAAPEWLIQECRWDTHEDNQTLFDPPDDKAESLT